MRWPQKVRLFGVTSSWTDPKKLDQKSNDLEVGFLGSVQDTEKGILFQYKKGSVKNFDYF